MLNEIGEVAEKQKRLKLALDKIVKAVNGYMRGEKHPLILKYLQNIEPGKKIPTWFTHFRETGKPHRADPKSLGTYIEKLVKAEISRSLRILVTGSAASGVDIHELLLNIKATSEKSPQSSEAYISAYDRVLGAKHDVLVFIYNGEEYLNDQSPNLKIVRAKYYEKSWVADEKLCKTARLLKSLVQGKKIKIEIGKRGLRAIVYAKKAGRDSRHYYAFRDTLAKGDQQQIESALAECERGIFLTLTDCRY